MTNLKSYPKHYKSQAFLNFVYLLLSADNVQEAIDLSKIVFTEKEVLSIGRRIEIAKRKLDGKTDKEIIDVLKTSQKTVTEVCNSLFETKRVWELVLNKSKKLHKKYKSRKWVLRKASMQVRGVIEETDYSWKSLER